jgi:hypothetical protein
MLSLWLYPFWTEKLRVQGQVKKLIWAMDFFEMQILKPNICYNLLNIYTKIYSSCFGKEKTLTA